MRSSAVFVIVCDSLYESYPQDLERNFISIYYMETIGNKRLNKATLSTTLRTNAVFLMQIYHHSLQYCLQQQQQQMGVQQQNNNNPNNKPLLRAVWKRHR